MRKSRYSEAQIVGILKEHQAGLGAGVRKTKVPKTLMFSVA